MRYYLKTGMLLVAGMLAVVSATSAEYSPSFAHPDFAGREASVRWFLFVSHSPLDSYAGEFIAEADAHGLDWRLLPAIAFVESGAGVHSSRLHNAFGWDNGTATFTSESAAIHHVAEALESSRFYKGRDLQAKLLSYNHDPDYGRLVGWVMKRIGE